MFKIIFDLPPKQPGTNRFIIPPGVKEATDIDAPPGKMLGLVVDATGWEIYDRDTYFPPVLPPTHRKKMSRAEFMFLIRKNEHRQIKRKINGLGGNPEDDDLMQYWEVLKGSDMIDMNNQLVIDAITQLKTSDVFNTPARLSAVLLGWPL